MKIDNENQNYEIIFKSGTEMNFMIFFGFLYVHIHYRKKINKKNEVDSDA